MELTTHYYKFNERTRVLLDLINDVCSQNAAKKIDIFAADWASINNQLAKSGSPRPTGEDITYHGIKILPTREKP